MSFTKRPDGSLVTSAQPLVLGNTSFKRTDDGSEQMAVDGTPAGGATVVWNGTGAGDTGGDWTPSGEGSETAASMHAGTNGWDTGSVPKDSTTYFTNSVDIDVSGYVTLRFWMQPKAFPAGSRLDIRWQTVAGQDRGVQLDVADYVTNYDLDVWQLVSIPMTDFAIGANNVGRIRLTYAKQAGQQFWFDDIELMAAGGGGPFTFRVEAEATEIWHTTMLVVLLTAPETGWNSDSFANIAGGLSNGLLVRQRRLSTSETLWSMNSKDNTDLFGRFHPQEAFTFADSNLLLGFMIKPGQASVAVTDDDVLEILVRDDLSTINNARAFLHYGLEVTT